MTRAGHRHGAEVVPIDSAYVESGTSLGSNENGFIKAPRVLLAWDAPTSSLSAGWTRYVLERRFGQAVTDGAHGARSAASTSPTSTCVVLPSGNYAGQIGDAVLTRLKDWLRGGGTLVTLAEATRWAIGEQRRAARHQRAAQGRTTRYARRRPAPASGGESSGSRGGASAGAPAAQRAPKPVARHAASPATAEAGEPRRPARPAAPSPEPDDATSTRRSSPIASGPTRSPARCCGPRSTPITG